MDAWAPPDVVSNSEPSLHPFFEYEVDFLHRTVKYFFQMNDIQCFIASRTPKTVNSCTLLCHAFLAQVKVAPIEMLHLDQAGELDDLIDDLVHYAHEAETQTAHPSVVLLDALSDAVEVHRDLLQARRPCGLWWKVCQSFLGFAVQKDLQLFVTHKLDERLRHGTPAWENDKLVLDALEPLGTSKYKVRFPNRRMLRILVDRGVDLNRPLRPFNVSDHVIGLIWEKWDCLSVGAKIGQLEMINALLEFGAEPNWSPGPDRLRWVQFILIPKEKWRCRDDKFRQALTKTILAFCERDIDPYWEFEGHSLWCHFMRSIYDEDHASARLSWETKAAVSEVIRKLWSLGAQLNDVIYRDVNKYEDEILVGLESLTATDILTRIFTMAELEEVYPESSKAKSPGARKRMKKKRRKERKKGARNQARDIVL